MQKTLLHSITVHYIINLSDRKMHNLENPSHGFVYSSPNSKDPVPIAHMIHTHQQATAVPLHPNPTEPSSGNGNETTGMDRKHSRNGKILVTPIDAKKTMAEISIPVSLFSICAMH